MPAKLRARYKVAGKAPLPRLLVSVSQLIVSRSGWGWSAATRSFVSS
jgi:hypothetical protein